MPRSSIYYSTFLRSYIIFSLHIRIQNILLSTKNFGRTSIKPLARKSRAKARDEHKENHVKCMGECLVI